MNKFKFIKFSSEMENWEIKSFKHPESTMKNGQTMPKMTIRLLSLFLLNSDYSVLTASCCGRPKFLTQVLINLQKNLSYVYVWYACVTESSCKTIMYLFRLNSFKFIQNNISTHFAIVTIICQRNLFQNNFVN